MNLVTTSERSWVIRVANAAEGPLGASHSPGGRAEFSHERRRENSRLHQLWHRRTAGSSTAKVSRVRETLSPLLMT